MPEWWTYSLSDFLLFSPRTYYRLFERHNLSVWPGQILTLGLGFLTVGLLRLRSPLQGRIISFILALLWAWVAWAFLWGRYASVNWAVTYLVPAFVAEALLFVWLGGSGREVSFRAGRDPVGILGSALLILSLALYPALAPLAGRPWEQAEIFGIAPDPTAIGTVGLVLLAGSRGTRGLLIVPIAWCLFSGATLWALGSREAWILLLAPALALGTLALPRKRQNALWPA